MKSKQAVLDNIGNLVTSLGAIAILLAVIFLIMATTRGVVEEKYPCDSSTDWFNATAGICQNASYSDVETRGLSNAYNASFQTSNAVSAIPGWLPIVVITLIGGILLTLVRFFKQ